MLGSGGRAAAALEILIDAGFTGTLYNGQGVSQWQAAGNSLVNTDSVVPPCTKSDIGTCVSAATTEEPVEIMIPTIIPTKSVATMIPTKSVATMIPTKIAGGDAAKSESNVMFSRSTVMLATLLLSATLLFLY